MIINGDVKDASEIIVQRLRKRLLFRSHTDFKGEIFISTPEALDTVNSN